MNYTIKNLKIPVISIIEGGAASSATMISVVCSHRIIYKNSYMLIHQLSSGVVGKYQDIEDERGEVEGEPIEEEPTQKNIASIDEPTNELIKEELSTVFAQPSTANPFNNVMVTDYHTNEEKKPAAPSYSKRTQENILESAKQLVADKAKLKEMCESCGKTHETVDYKNSIEEKLEKLIAAAEVKNVSEMHFMNFLGESKKNEFDSLSEDKKVLIVESMNSDSIMSTVQAENVWDSCFITERKVINFIDDMPSKYSDKWNSLSESRKEQIISESKFHSVPQILKL